MGEHTPGPWHWIFNDQNGRALLVHEWDDEDGGHGSTTIVYHKGPEPTFWLEDDADARLIAAAPDQHDALKMTTAAIRAYLVAAGRAPNNRDPEEINAAALALVDALPIGDAAIAKATG